MDVNYWCTDANLWLDFNKVLLLIHSQLLGDSWINLLFGFLLFLVFWIKEKSTFVKFLEICSLKCRTEKLLLCSSWRGLLDLCRENVFKILLTWRLTCKVFFVVGISLWVWWAKILLRTSVRTVENPFVFWRKETLLFSLAWVDVFLHVFLIGREFEHFRLFVISFSSYWLNTGFRDLFFLILTLSKNLYQNVHLIVFCLFLKRIIWYLTLAIFLLLIIFTLKHNSLDNFDVIFGLFHNAFNFLGTFLQDVSDLLDVFEFILKIQLNPGEFLLKLCFAYLLLFEQFFKDLLMSWKLNVGSCFS